MFGYAVEPPECKLCGGEHKTPLCENYGEYLDALDEAFEQRRDEAADDRVIEGGGSW